MYLLICTIIFWCDFVLFICLLLCFFFFFFSSRRRHTRLVSDWSSDVCSSDLSGPVTTFPGIRLFPCCRKQQHQRSARKDRLLPCVRESLYRIVGMTYSRSEERRVGKECRSRWEACH